jgi:hypothetical protein
LLGRDDATSTHQLVGTLEDRRDTEALDEQPSEILPSSLNDFRVGMLERKLRPRFPSSILTSDNREGDLEIPIPGGAITKTPIIRDDVILTIGEDASVGRVTNFYISSVKTKHFFLS